MRTWPRASPTAAATCRQRAAGSGASTSLLLISLRVGTRRGSVMRTSLGRTTTLAMASQTSC